MIRPQDVPEAAIQKALRTIRKPMEQHFNSRQELRDRDFVQMRLRELAHLLAWYSMLEAGGHRETDTQHNFGEIREETPRRLPSRTR